MMASSVYTRVEATYTWDDVRFDLAVPLRDRHGTTWTWTGEWNPDGEPLMAPGDGLAPVPLPDLYRDGWPLRPVLPRLPSGVGALLARPRTSPEGPPQRALPGPECAAACGRTARPGTAYCGPDCRNRDDRHDYHDTPEDD